jgi:DNA-directed RNA polymerase subunit beta'
LIDLGAPEIILRNEKRMLQESVDSLIDASQRKATRRGRGRQPLRSLSDMLKGKQGRFRQNLLGKRVDYSGRSVIIIGPELKLNQCGLPKEMALEMFKPFVLREMIMRGVAPNVKSAKNMLERRPPEVFDILEEITKNHPVILNRAPTLHKLSIQAFYPVLIEGSAIRIHPAVCSGFNADFDGDQMAVHIPLSKKAVNEAETLMLPEHNLLRPADGSPIATPSSKEMALGVYYLTSIDTRIKEYDGIFADKDEAIFANQAKKIEYRQKITVRIDGKLLETTAGRILFNEAIPSDFGFINEAVTSTVIKQIFAKAYAHKDTKIVVEMIDTVKDLGFFGGTMSGLSFGIFDAKILPEKEKILKESDKKVAQIEANFSQGLITSEEKKRLSQEIWIETTEEVADKTWEMLDENSPIRVVIDAKVGRASRDQVKQLAAIRGLIVDPLGKIVELPIKSNFKEGLSVFEYVTSSRGSRKGLTDTALKTADAGYLTRRLVDVTHDVLVRSEDCGTKEGLLIRRSDRPKAFIARVLHRILAEDIKGPKGKVIVAKGILVGDEEAKLIEEAKTDEAVVRSPLTCAMRYGICSACYGRDLSNKEMVEIGTPVGVIAAQSIGEPGTQLTLKTKHSAGIVGLDVTQGLPRVEELFEARTPKILSPLSEIPGRVRISEGDEGWKVTVTSVSSKPKEEREYIIPKTIQLAVEDKQLVDAGTPLAKGNLDIKEILSIKGLRSSQEYLVKEIQAVYESQGIPIHDKHFEVIIRKMSDEVRVITSGDTPLLPGELVGKSTFEEETEKVLAAGGEPASAQQVVLGITRRALFTESWLSAASFEQTTDVLTNAGLSGREDKLVGLKENVIIGRLIPVTPERALLTAKQL